MDNQDYNTILNMKVRCQVLLEDFEKVLTKMENEGKRKPRQKKNKWGLSLERAEEIKNYAIEQSRKRDERAARRAAQPQ